MSEEIREVLIEELLQARFDASEVKAYTKEWTAKSGERKSAGPFSYVEDEAVMDRLDEVLRFGNWGTQAQPVGDSCVLVTLRCRDPKSNEWVEFQDFGYPTNADSAEPLKEAWTDGFRRVARQAGVARYVYAGEVDTPPVVRTTAPPQPQATQPAPAPTTAGDPADGLCPAHKKPWRLGNYGWYCSSLAVGNQKANQRGYCAEKPSQAWVARQELAA